MNSEKLLLLRDSVKEILSKKRYNHTLGVEKTAVEIGKCCLPNKLYGLSVAALLHDVAKELPEDRLLGYMKGLGAELTEEDFASKALYHAFAAPNFIKERFSEFATEEIIKAVFEHTSGGADMTVFSEIIFVADFVEPGRTYERCISLREKLFSLLSLENSTQCNIDILHRITLDIIDFTVKYLSIKDIPVNSRMLLARNSIFDKITPK